MPTVTAPTADCSDGGRASVTGALVPNACALMPNGFPITCVDANDCFAAGFDSSTLCIGTILAYPDNYCFQACTQQ